MCFCAAFLSSKVAFLNGTYESLKIKVYSLQFKVFLSLIISKITMIIVTTCFFNFAKSLPSFVKAVDDGFFGHEIFQVERLEVGYIFHFICFQFA